MQEKATVAVIAIHHARDSNPVILMTFFILSSLEKSLWYQQIILILAQLSGAGDKIVETQINYGKVELKIRSNVSSRNKTRTFRKSEN